MISTEKAKFLPREKANISEHMTPLSFDSAYLYIPVAKSCDSRGNFNVCGYVYIIGGFSFSNLGKV